MRNGILFYNNFVPNALLIKIKIKNNNYDFSYQQLEINVK